MEDSAAAASVFDGDRSMAPGPPFLAGALGAFVVVAAFQGHPPPGGSGRELGVTVALVVFALFMFAMVVFIQRPRATQLVLVVAVVVSASTLVGFQPEGPGFLGIFPAVAAAGVRFDQRRSMGVAILAVLGLAVAYTVGRHQPVDGVVINELGVVAFYVIAVFARRLRESNVRAHALLAELEQSRAAQAQAAALAERQRLAREMHDVLAHTLSGLVLTLEGARLQAAQDGATDGVGVSLERAQQLARSGLDEARRAIGMLRDDALPGPERLAGLAADFEAATGVACSLSVDGTERALGSDGRLTLYRVAQEALTNVSKHARPSRVELRLTYEPSGTLLSVEDFSTSGERPPPGEGSGYGLTGMRERAELSGGTLDARATAQGFRVQLWLPA